MKLLTPEERALLSRMAQPCEHEPDRGDSRRATPAELAIVEMLCATGRGEIIPCPLHPQQHLLCAATPAGREALRLWALLAERGLVTP